VPAQPPTGSRSRRGRSAATPAQFDGRALEAEEARALRRTTFTMFEDDEGTCHGRFRIPAAQGQVLTKMILAICSPTRSASDTAASTTRASR
jgi:hypothetical protein